MIYSIRKDRERPAGGEPAGRFSIFSVYQVQKLASDKAQIKFERNDISWQKHNQVQKGDIIFNYKASNTVHLRYPHVVIAAGSYSGGKVAVHGHTENHKDWDKSINSTNCKCYRVVSGAPLEAREKLVTLPTTGSGATVN